jgi:hypothetical protein
VVLLTAVAERRLGVDHGRTLPGPFLFGHRPIADHVLAQQRARELLAVYPVLRIAVLQPEDARGDVGRQCSRYGAMKSSSTTLTVFMLMALSCRCSFAGSRLSATSPARFFASVLASSGVMEPLQTQTDELTAAIGIPVPQGQREAANAAAVWYQWRCCWDAKRIMEYSEPVVGRTYRNR